MGKLVSPNVYWVGYTQIHDHEIMRFLKDSGNEDFWRSIQAARNAGLTGAEILCSMFAKLCYRSLTLGKNENLTRVRDIRDNITGCFNTGHGSVFEHVGFNFIINNCSRVFTHELVRHRVGTAFSQTSGRYCRLDEIDIVFDPILEPVRKHVLEIQEYLEKKYAEMVRDSGLDQMKDFADKKKMTSALRRIAPNGQSNEIGVTLNLRALRHTIMMRTNRHSEWEIRTIFAQIYTILRDRYPTIFHGAKEERIDGILEISGMKLQPYEKGAAEVLASLTNEQLQQELERRKQEQS